jgi:hypothetical protein
VLLLYKEEGGNITAPRQASHLILSIFEILRVPSPFSGDCSDMGILGPFARGRGRAKIDRGPRECKGCHVWFERNPGESAESFQKRAYCTKECKQDTRLAKAIRQHRILKLKLTAKAAKVTLAVDAQTAKAPEECRPTFQGHAPGCPAIAQAWSQRIEIETPR